ncbi:MAG: hypothetical protein FD152_1252 [Xanthobacteraceae bacterium]|nr:MAG: hypothetical protein FD152_1252 [Xanthobacteraceae bacterium]
MSNLSQSNHPTCIVTPQELALIKRKFDCTCEELGVFPEDESARRSLGRALMAALARGDVDLEDASTPSSAATETLRFEGEELVVAIVDPRPRH